MSAREYGQIIVVGGGCYGAYYVRQLERARVAGALAYETVVVVDHDPACRVAAMGGEARLCVADWSAFFDSYLAAAPTASCDAIVPSPLMPHLMYQWIVRRAAARWPSRVVETRPLHRDAPVPWRRDAPDGTAYVSFATWTCPVNCIEPRRCPHTRDTRDWSMPDAARALVASAAAEGEPLQGPVIFHCTHRAFGVGMFDTSDVVNADAFVTTVGERGAADVLVGTVSHCHGALNVLHIGA